MSGSEYSEHDIKLVNICEQSVIAELEKIWKGLDICHCTKCFYDVCALALNHIPPSYATTNAGEVISSAKILQPEFKNILLVELAKAVARVSKDPGHD